MTSLDVPRSVHQVHGLSVKQAAHPHLKLLLLDTPLVVDAVLLQDQLQFKEEKRIKVTTIAVWRSRGLLLVRPGKGVTRKGVWLNFDIQTSTQVKVNDWAQLL